MVSLEKSWWWRHLHEASFRRQISMNCLISETSLGILATFRRVMEVEVDALGRDQVLKAKVERMNMDIESFVWEQAKVRLCGVLSLVAHAKSR